MADTVADKALSALSNIPFRDILAGPLNACIDAQNQAAMSTVNYIKEVGLTEKEDPNTHATVQEAVYVQFSFIQAGRKMNINVPLLAIVPIPYIAISTIDISFKCAVTGVDTTSDSEETSVSIDRTNKSSSSGGLGILRKRKTSSMTTTVSSKKDSKSTQDSSYSIESTLDINVHAAQESMPAGMSKVLELLNSAVSLCLPDGELTVSENYLELKEGEKAYVTISYKTGEGVLEPKAIKVTGTGAETKTQNDTVICVITGGTADAKIKVSVDSTYDTAQKYKDGVNITVKKIS